MFSWPLLSDGQRRGQEIRDLLGSKIIFQNNNNNNNSKPIGTSSAQKFVWPTPTPPLLYFPFSSCILARQLKSPWLKSHQTFGGGKGHRWQATAILKKKNWNSTSVADSNFEKFAQKNACVVHIKHFLSEKIK